MSYQSEVLADNPLLYFTCEEASGNSLANLGSLGGSGTILGSGYTRNVAHSNFPGVGVGAKLPGVSTCYATYPDTLALDILGDVTYEGIFTILSFAGGVFLMTKGGTNPTSDGGYALYVGPDRVINILKSNGSTYLLLGTTGMWPNDGSEHHIAFTRVGNLYTLYLDGVSIATSTNSTPLNGTAQPFLIGAYASDANATPGAAANIKFDEIAVYNTGLPASRIIDHVRGIDPPGYNWPTATGIVYSVYRGSSGCGFGSTRDATDASVIYRALTLGVLDGTSWVGANAFHKNCSAASLAAPPAGMVNRGAQRTGLSIAHMDTNSGQSSNWAQQTVGVDASGKWVCCMFEILHPSSHIAESFGFTDTLEFPVGTVLGDLVVCSAFSEPGYPDPIPSGWTSMGQISGPGPFGLTTAYIISPYSVPLVPPAPPTFIPQIAEY